LKRNYRIKQTAIIQI